MSNENARQISALPLLDSDLDEFVKIANEKFEDILQTIEAKYPGLVRQLWKPEQYIYETLKEDMLPIDRNYALSLVEAFLIHHVIKLATKTDDQGLQLN
jgi:hypothetical protein